jgi:hypothetical protein
MWVRARDGVGSEFGFSLTTFPADEDDDDAPGGGALGEAGGAEAALGGAMRRGDGPDAPATRADSGATVG